MLSFLVSLLFDIFGVICLAIEVLPCGDTVMIGLELVYSYEKLGFH